MRKILSVIISLCLIFPVCDVQAFRLEPFYMGMVAKHVPESDKQKFEQVSKNCATAIDCSGYVDRYLELYSIVMQNCKEKHGRNYKIKTPDDFLKIYELLHNTQFKVLRTTTEPSYDFIYTNHPNHARSSYYVLFPMHYDNFQDYDKSSNKDYLTHLYNLSEFEREITLAEPRIINDHCIRPEVFFQICFDINEQMYPKCCCCDINKKYEFRTKLQDFLVKQTISWTNSMFMTPYIKKIPTPNKFLTLHELNYLRNNLENRTFGVDLISEYEDLKPAFVTTQDSDSVFKQEVYDFQMQHVIDGLWKQCKLTRNYSYVADIKGKKLRISPNADGNIDCLHYSKLDSMLDSPGLKDWRTYKSGKDYIGSNGSCHHPLAKMCKPWRRTFDWLCGLDFDSFKKDFNEFVCNCDTYKLYKLKTDLLESFEYLSSTRGYDHYAPTTLDYLGEVLFEDEQNHGCVHYDGILNLLYIFDFFEFPKNVTDQIIKYVFGEMIRRCPSINSLYTNEKFEQVVKLSQKLWSINNNDIFLNLKDTLISRILSNTILYTIDSKLSELDSYHDFISYMAHTLDVSTSEKEIILQSMRETLQKLSSQTKTLKKQKKATLYAPLNTVNEPKPSQTDCKKANFNKYIDSSKKSIGLSDITAETNGNYYENLPSSSELNTTDKTNSKTTSTELETNTKKVTPANKFSAATAVGVLNAIIPKLYRKIVKFRKTSNGIKKLKTLNNVINLAS